MNMLGYKAKGIKAADWVKAASQITLIKQARECQLNYATGGPNVITAAATAKSIQSCPTLCDPTDGSPPGSPVPGILQARTLEWIAISFSNAWKWKVKEKSLSCVRLLATPWTAAHQAPLSMGFSRQEYWSGMPLPSLNVITGSLKVEEEGHRERCKIAGFEDAIKWDWKLRTTGGFWKLEKARKWTFP